MTTPKPSADECRRYYETHPERFTSGDLVEARHILFAIMPGTPVMALRERAERVLAELRAAPEAFAARAQELSNCPSGQHGGNLGQFGRGEMVPEFDKAIFGTQATGVLPDAGRPRATASTSSPWSAGSPASGCRSRSSRDRVADYLAARVEERALKQYVEVLAGRADIAGADLAGAASPLVQ